MRILITSNSFGKYDDSPRRTMESLGWEIIENRYKRIMNEEEMMAEVVDVDGIILGSDPVTKQVLAKANKLKIISRYGVGIDNIDLQEAQARNIQVTVTKNSNSEAVADYAIGLMLATLRHIADVDHKLKEGDWVKETGLDLHGKTVGIFGLGAIGKGVAKRLSGFDCTILGYDLFIDEDFCKQYNVEVCDKETILKEADILSLHIPGNSDGSPFIGKGELQLIKDKAVLINTARASLVDEPLIVEALSSGKLYGYGTDVFSSEPNIPYYFHDLKKAVLSPHMAAVSVEAINKMTTMAVSNLTRYFEKKE